MSFEDMSPNLIQPWYVNGGLWHGEPDPNGGKVVPTEYKHGDRFVCTDRKLIAELRYENLPEEQRKFRHPILMTEAEFYPPETVTQIHAGELAERDATIAALRQQLEEQTKGVKRATLKEPPNNTEV